MATATQQQESAARCRSELFMTRPRALVIGGSVGGLFAANLLRGIGWDVTVFERAAGDLGDRGAGIGTRPELFAVMRRIGLDTDASIGIEVQSRICLDRSGSVIHEVPTRAVTSSWAHLRRALKRRVAGGLLPRRARSSKGVEQDAASVTAIFADGTRAQGDLLVAADGIHSTVRQQFLPALAPVYAGYVAWRGVVTGPDISTAFHATVFHHMIFGFPPEGLILSIPMPGPGGGRACNFVWFQLVDYDRTLPLLCTDESGHQHGYSIPPPLIQPKLISALKSTASALFAPQVAAVVAGDDAADPAADLRSGIAAPRVRARGAPWRCRLRRAAACRDRRDESRARRPGPRRRARPQRRSWCGARALRS